MQIEGHPIEILAIERARSVDPETKGNPVCVFTFRDHPEEGGLERHVLMHSPHQCIRIRDSIDEFLNDHDSWLYVPKAQQQEMSGSGLKNAFGFGLVNAVNSRATEVNGEEKPAVICLI